MTGTFAIPNSVFEDKYFEEDRPLSRREAVAWLAKHVRWTDNCVLRRGQGSWSERYLAEAWKWARTKVQRFLKKLELMNLIRLESGPGRGPVEKVITYLFSMSSRTEETADGPAPGQDRASTGPKTNSGNSGNEDSIDDPFSPEAPKAEWAGAVPPEVQPAQPIEQATPSSAAPPPKKPRAKKSQVLVPEGWHPRQDTIAKLAEELSVTPEQLERERLKFIDNSQSKGRTYIELDSGFRNWARNAKGYGHFNDKITGKSFKEREYSI